MRYLRLLLAAANLCLAADRQPVYLWSNGAPGSEGKTAQESVRTTPQGEQVLSSIHKSSITPYLPAKEKRPVRQS